MEMFDYGWYGRIIDTKISGGSILKKLEYKPYDFDIDYEKRTYDYIGRDYAGKNVGILCGLRKWQNKNEKKYKVCDTYTDWEEHVKDNICIEILNYKDFMHWLRLQLRQAENKGEGIKNILIPIYIAIAPILELFYPEVNERIELYVLFLIYIIITCFSAYMLKKMSNEIAFWKDYIELAELCKSSRD